VLSEAAAGAYLDLDDRQWPNADVLEAGAWLCREGEPVRDVFNISEGLVRLVHVAPTNQSIAVGLRWPGSLIGGVGATLDRWHRVSAKAALPTRVRRLTAAEFRQRLGATPEFLTQATGAMMREFQDELDDSIRPCLSHPEQRLSALLFTHGAGPSGHGAPSAEVRLPAVIVSSDLADLLHISRDRLSLLLRRWQSSGYVRPDGEAMAFRRVAWCANDASLPKRIPDQRVKDVIRLIHKQSAHATLDLQQLSRQVNLSLWHLSRLFRRSTGVGFRDFVNAVRLDRARVALETTHLSVKEIAAIAGYNHTSELTRRFKAAHGVSPTAYRASLA
jgi:AraC-like DNA-binding protein/CRP-like cAMP-binding protein